jgi:hypothetical protein
MDIWTSIWTSIHMDHCSISAVMGAPAAPAAPCRSELQAATRGSGASRRRQRFKTPASARNRSGRSFWRSFWSHEIPVFRWKILSNGNFKKSSAGTLSPFRIFTQSQSTFLMTKGFSLFFFASNAEFRRSVGMASDLKAPEPRTEKTYL